MTNDERNPKPKCRKTLSGGFAGFVIRISSFLRISSFVIRIWIAAVLAFAGCTHSRQDADLVIINGAEPESLDPAVLTGEADGRVALELFAGLTRYNPTDATPVPDLAESWDLSADGKTYT